MPTMQRTRTMGVRYMTEYIPGMKIRAGYWTSVYKPNLSGWRSEYVKAELEVITPKKARVTDAVMYK